MTQSPRYVVVTPARDEASYIAGTVASMAAQTLLPTRWIIVNDGSTDDTGAILDGLAAEHEWLTVVHREDRGFRQAGGGVMQAFYAGFDVNDIEDWDYLVKLDGDLSFEPDYFERCLAHFDEDAGLGVGGGVIDNLIDGERVLERHPEFHVRGATKIYRRACWDAIDGLFPVAGWDTLDEVKASQLGWKTRSFHELVLLQHRFTGDAAGQWSNWVKNGRASWICGYHWLFLMAKALRRAFRKPFLTASTGLLWGFFRAALTDEQRIDDPGLIRFVKVQQLRKLVGLGSIWH